ncbi:MAG: hypothetical protein ACKVP0_28750 [Pirellulaceae bacterium]
MNETLSTLIRTAGFLQWSVLIASALVPIRLNWKRDLGVLPRLHRQLFWTYGGYTVLSIVSLGLLCVTLAESLADGTTLARALCGFIAVFWGIRLGLQFVLDARPYLTAWWQVVGEVLLTVLFLSFTLLFAVVAIWS